MRVSPQKQVTRNIKRVPSPHVSATNHQEEPHTPAGHSQLGLLAGGLDISGGMMFGGRSNHDDLDASVVDVQIGDHELKDFDEEFSDVGEIDNTLHDEGDGRMPYREERQSFPLRQYQTRPSDYFGQVDVSSQSNIFGPGTSDHSVDIFDHPYTPPNGDAETNNYDRNIPSYDEPDMSLDELGQRGEATGQRSDELEGRGRLGEGQEDDVRMYNRKQKDSGKLYVYISGL